jgi:redox-sensitive bicupin YhaK (pirin superfamily)
LIVHQLPAKIVLAWSSALPISSMIRHSEYNASQTEPVHFLQIWIIPSERGLVPGYEQRAFPLDEHQGKRILIASKDGHDGSVTVHQDVDVWVARFSPGEQSSFPLKPSRISGHKWRAVP